MDTITPRPKLKDLSQGSRIAFVRHLRRVSQDYVSNKLGLTGECKRRTMTRYEKGNRNPKEERTREIAKILDVDYNSIKKYDLSDPLDVIFILMWIEELYEDFGFRLNLPNKDSDEKIKNTIKEWNIMKRKLNQKEIDYNEYIEWKIKFNTDKSG